LAASWADGTPETMRRRLKAALRSLRAEAGITQLEAAAAMDWSSSKLIRIESGAVGLSVTDLRALLVLYRVRDEETIAELIELARGSKRQSWSEYSDVYSPAARTLFGHEAAAKIIYKHEPTIIPGILQTEEYARAVLESAGYREHEIERMESARLERQELLDRDPHPELQFILGEASVSWLVGGGGVMTNQLRFLKYLARRPEVCIQILPFAAGAHRRIEEAFTILEFADPHLDDLLYLENVGGESIGRDEPELIASYRYDFLTLQRLASERAALADVIDTILERWGERR
jgi:transcriptional regulator with XRE-family HTH domain